jgi:hypothetical protein
LEPVPYHLDAEDDVPQRLVVAPRPANLYLLSHRSLPLFGYEGFVRVRVTKNDIARGHFVYDRFSQSKIEPVPLWVPLPAQGESVGLIFRMGGENPGNLKRTLIWAGNGDFGCPGIRNWLAKIADFLFTMCLEFAIDESI